MELEAAKQVVVEVLREYYEGLEEKVEIKMHGAATGDTK